MGTCWHKLARVADAEQVDRCLVFLCMFVFIVYRMESEWKKEEGIHRRVEGKRRGSNGFQKLLRMVSACVCY